MRLVEILVSVSLISLPLYIIRCRTFAWCVSPIPFTLLEVLILLTFFVWLIWRYRVKKTHESLYSRFKRLTRPFFWPAAVFLLAATISVFSSPDLREAAGIWKAYFIEPAILFLVILDLTLVKKYLFWLPAFLFSGFWLSALSFWQVYTGVDPFAPYAIEQGRATAVYTTPNALALYLGPLTFLAVGGLATSFKEKTVSLGKLILFAGVIIFYLSAIYFSKSRGGLIGIGFSLSYFLILMATVKFRSIQSWGALFFPAVIILTLVFSAFVVLRTNGLAPSGSSVRNSLETRYCLWQSTKNILLSSPITGTGLSGFPLVYPRYATCEKETFQYPHNLYLNFWTEIGIFGLGAFLWIIHRCWQILRKFTKDPIAIGILTSFIYIFVHGLVDVPYFKNDLAVEFWIILAVVAWFSLRREGQSGL